MQEWLDFQISVQQVAQERLQKRRERYLGKVNRKRKPTVYREGDWVLVHKRRFPQWTTTAFGSQWFGPHRVVKTQANSLKIRASPKLGGEVDVAHEFLKRYPLDPADSDSEGEDVEAIEEDERQQTEEVPSPPEQDVNEAEGFFEVEEILKHKYHKGWYFLTKWRNWPLGDSTWEPTRAFVHPRGALNEEFRRYCQEKGADRPLRDALKIIDRMQAR